MNSGCHEMVDRRIEGLRQLNRRRRRLPRGQKNESTVDCRAGFANSPRRDGPQSAAAPARRAVPLSKVRHHQRVVEDKSSSDQSRKSDTPRHTSLPDRRRVGVPGREVIFEKLDLLQWLRWCPCHNSTFCFSRRRELILAVPLRMLRRNGKPVTVSRICFRV